MHFGKKYSYDCIHNNEMDPGICFKTLRYALCLISASSPVRSGASKPFILSLELLYNFGLGLSDLD